MCCCVSTVSSANVEAGLWPVDLADSLGGGAVRLVVWRAGAAATAATVSTVWQASTVLKLLLLSSLHSHNQTCVALCPPDRYKVSHNIGSTKSIIKILVVIM